MKLRPVLLTLAAIGIPLSLLVLLLPITWGYGGYFYSIAGGMVTYSDPAGPGYAAGLRVGQHVIPLTGMKGIEQEAGPVGTVVHIRIIEDGRVRPVRVTFVPFSGTLAVQQLADKIVEALTALLACSIAIVVLLRARDGDLGQRAGIVLIVASMSALSQAAALVCKNALPAFILHRELPILLNASTLCAIFAFLAAYPPQQTRVRRTLAWFGPLLVCTAVAAIVNDVTFVTTPTLLLPVGAIKALFAIGGLGVCAAIAACIDAVARALPSQAAAVRWLCGLWIVGLLFALAPIATFLFNVGTILNTHYGDILHAGWVACLSFGVIYPVLRHRMVELNILVSRATVFTTVSLVIVALFIAAEWAIGKIFEHSFGLSNERGGAAAQLLTLAVVLVLGLSARSIHRFIDERLTSMFFRSRLQGLAQIEAAAQEADAATDARAVIEIAVDTVQRCLEPLGTAIYLHADDRYALAASNGTLAFASSYAYNDVPLLKLRRWLKEFRADDGSLYLPMLVRGDLVGFLVCGPKRDHTSYLSDDVAALSSLAHHAGLAQAMLREKAVSPRLTLAPG